MAAPTRRSLDELRLAAARLLESIKERLTELETLLDKVQSHWGYEDPVYRFYHQSFKVFLLQERTEEVTAVLGELAPSEELNPWFLTIVNEGTGRRFSREDNSRWPEATRPILEAFFHARFFLEMAVKYGREFEESPEVLPSGWAALLYLYQIR